MKVKTAITAIVATVMLQTALVHSANGRTLNENNRIVQNGFGRNGANIDQTFVSQASETGLFEIQLGQLALLTSTNTDVLSYAQQLVNDHTAANTLLAQIAAANTNGLTMSTNLNRAHQQQLDRLERLADSNPGVKFDRAFVQTAIATHQQSIRLFRQETDRGQDPDLRAFAEVNLPILEEHLDTAKQLAKTLKKHH
jgi:putative membrane protein